MFENLDPSALTTQITAWLGANILTPDFAVQSGILLISFVLAYIGQKALRPRLTDLINKLRVPYRISEIFRQMIKLVSPTLALIMIFVGSHVAGAEALGFNVTFSMGIMKLLVAWILIRLVVQFIENRFARNTIALVIWTFAALSIFGILDQTTATLDAVGMDIGDFRLSALTVTKGLLAIFLLLYGALFFSKVIERRIAKAASLTPSSRVLLSKMTRVAFVTCGLLIGLTTAGIDLSLFAVFSGAVGLGVGFGMQKVISNLFSGVLLLMDQSIKPGDIIELPNPANGSTSTFGWVNQMGARFTEIMTRDNKSYLIPNEDFITQQVINWSHGNTLVRVETKFGVHYDSDPHQVKALAEEAATKPERVVDSPSPVCHLIEFGDSSLNFVLRYWIRDAEKGVTNTRGPVMMALWDAFKENGVKIPYPQRDIHIHEKKK